MAQNLSILHNIQTLVLSIMAKFISTLILFIGGFGALSAQDAKAILDKLAETSKAYTTIQGKFQYKLENKSANLYENSEGKFIIKGNKYFIDILGAETYYDGENLYSFIKDVDEVTIQSPEENDEDFLKPSNLFYIYKKGYDYKYVGKIIEEGKSIHVIDLLPKTDDSNYKKLIVKIESKTNRLVSMKSIGKSGDNVEINILNMKENLPVADSKFVFNKTAHPKVEIIDMR